MSYNIDPEVLRARGVVAANTRWAAEPNRTKATAKMRQGFLDKLQREAREKLGPGATDEQVAKAADNALKAHYAKMRLNSLLTRQRRAREQAEALAGAILSGPIADAMGEPAPIPAPAFGRTEAEARRAAARGEQLARRRAGKAQGPAAGEPAA